MGDMDPHCYQHHRIPLPGFARPCRFGIHVCLFCCANLITFLNSHHAFPFDTNKEVIKVTLEQMLSDSKFDLLLSSLLLSMLK